jgi:hypothetical protein
MHPHRAQKDQVVRPALKGHEARESVVDPFDRKVCVAQGGFGSKTCRGLDRSDAMASPSECRRVPSRPRADVKYMSGAGRKHVQDAAVNVLECSRLIDLR